MSLHALFVGINRYPGFGPVAQLEGAVADVEALSGLLRERWGLGADAALYRLESEATRQRILDGLETLLERLRRNDRVLFFFSGHGSQITDREGDEGDGLDETLVPCDSGRGAAPNRDISDDEIHRWAARVLEKTPHLVQIFDCCHSATLHRPRWRVRSVPADRRPRHALPPSPLVRPPSDRWREMDPADSPIHLAACGDRQLAYEVPHAGEVRGLFSRHLVEVLREASPATSWRRLFATVRARVHAESGDQRPMISGAGIDRAWGPPDRQAASRNAVNPDTVDSNPVDPRQSAARLLRLAREPAGWSIDLFRSRRGPWRRLDAGGVRAGECLRVDLRFTPTRDRPHRRPHYVYLVDIGVTRRALQVFPEPHGHEALDPGPTLSLGDRRGSELEIYWPENAPPELSSARCHLIVIASRRRIAYEALARADLPEDALVVARPYRLVR